MFDLSRNVSTNVSRIDSTVSTNASVMFDLSRNVSTNVSRIDSTVSTNASVMFDLSRNVSTNASVMFDLSRNVSTNVSRIDSTVSTNASVMFDLSRNVSTNVSRIDSTISTNVSRIDSTISTNASVMFDLSRNVSTNVSRIDSTVSTNASVMFDLSRNVSTNASVMFDLSRNVSRNASIMFDISSNVSALTQKTAGMTGNSTSIKFLAETVFNRMAETINQLSSNIIDYSSITSAMYFIPPVSSVGPRTYDIRNVPDLSTNSHMITILTNGSIVNNYGNVITVNGNLYNLQWNNGDNPADIVANLVDSNIITQQICILPANFKANTAISNISVFKSLV